MRQTIAALVRNESGVTALEYGLIAALIAIVCVSLWGSIGTSLQNSFTIVANDL